MLDTPDRPEADINPDAHPTAPRKNSTWTAGRIALLGYMLGRGYSYDEVAEHPQMGLSRDKVYRAASRLGVTRMERRAPVPRGGRTDPVRQAARARGIPSHELVSRLIGIVTNDPDLIANVLDDGVEAQR